MVGNGSYKLAFIAYFSQGLINSFWKLEHISLAGVECFSFVVVSFSTFLLVPPLAFLDQSFADFFVVAKVKVSTFIFHHTGRLQMTFLWNLGLKNNHQWCRLPMPTLQFFLSLSSFSEPLFHWPCNTDTYRFRVLKTVGWDALQKCLHLPYPWKHGL